MHLKEHKNTDIKYEISIRQIKFKFGYSNYPRLGILFVKHVLYLKCLCGIHIKEINVNILQLFYSLQYIQTTFQLISEVKKVLNWKCVVDYHKEYVMITEFTN